MKGFDEEWYREYEAKRRATAAKSRPSPKPLEPSPAICRPPLPDQIGPMITTHPMLMIHQWPMVISIRKPFKLLNPLLRMHWAVRQAYAKRLSEEIGAAAVWRLPYPLPRASVRIERLSIQAADEDGVTGGAKLVIDALLKRSETHPHGLGFLVDDSPAHMVLTVIGRKVRSRVDQGTTITIMPLE